MLVLLHKKANLVVALVDGVNEMTFFGKKHRVSAVATTEFHYLYLPIFQQISDIVREQRRHHLGILFQIILLPIIEIHVLNFIMH